MAGHVSTRHVTLSTAASQATGMPTTRSRAAAADPCSICLGQIDDRLVLPCSHGYCRGCVDELFRRHADAGDYASRCPQCRQPLFGQADIHFTGGMQLLDQISEGQSITSVNAAVELFELCISDVQPYASGPNGLNRMASAAKYNVGRCFEYGYRYGRDPTCACQGARYAADAYRAAFEMSHGTDSMAACNLAAMLCELEQPQEAQIWLERACTIDPADSLARVNLAIVTMENGDLDRARNVIQMALSNDPEYARAHNTSGVIYQRLGMLEEARGAYSRALQLDPLLTDATENLSELESE